MSTTASSCAARTVSSASARRLTAPSRSTGVMEGSPGGWGASRPRRRRSVPRSEPSGGNSSTRAPGPSSSVIGTRAFSPPHSSRRAIDSASPSVPRAFPRSAHEQDQSGDRRRRRASGPRVAVLPRRRSAHPGGRCLPERRMLHALCGLPGKKRLIHFSSVAVYGSCIDARRNTFERPRPDQPYGRHKLDLERCLWRGLRASAHEAVVLRLGHVYGAGQWLSRFVLEAARDPQFRLPFDGRLPSGAVHARNVGAAIRRLILDWPQPGTYNLFDAPVTTWRQVFDWNAQAVGVSRVPALGDEESERVAAYCRRQAATPLGVRLASEITAWIRTLPGSFIAACPAVKTLGIVTLATLRYEGLERRLLKRYKVMAARAGGGAAAVPALDSWLLSEGAPGAQLSYRGEIDIHDATAVAAWHQRYAEPDSILNW